MWLKGIGALMIITATAGLGYFKGMEYKKQIEEIERLKQVIWQLRGEMKYTRISLGEICKRVAGKTNEVYREWLTDIAKQLSRREHKELGELWKTETNKLTKKLHLPEEEKRELTVMGYQLGNMDIEMQENVLLWFERKLEEKWKLLTEKIEERRKLCNCLGIASGVLLVILIW